MRARKLLNRRCASRRDELQANVSAAIASCRPLHEPEQLLELIKTPEGADVRLRLRSEIRKRVKEILLSFPSFPEANLVGFNIVYTNGTLRVGAFDRNGERYDSVEVRKDGTTAEPVISLA